MRKVIAVFILLCSMAAHAQLTVFTSGPGQASYSQATREKNMGRLRNSTTIFILQYRDYAELEQYERVIHESWTYTPYKIIRPEELPGYEGKTGYSFFTFGAYYTGKKHYTQHLTYSLWTPMLNKKQHFKKQYFHVVLLLYPEYNMRLNMYPYYAAKNKYDVSQMKNMLDSVNFHNWNPAFLRGYLRAANARLHVVATMDGSRHFSDSKLADLKKDTLYIPNYARIKEQGWKVSYVLDTSMTEASLKSSYPYPVKFISTEKLSKLILEDSCDIHYLSFVIDGSDKYVSVYSSHAGVLYSSWHILSWTFKDKDLARIANSIEHRADTLGDN